MRGGRPTDRLARANLAAQPAKGDVALCGLLLGNHCSFQSPFAGSCWEITVHFSL
jgi:hypothetical protein